MRNPVKQLLFIMPLAALLALTACDKDDSTPQQNESEVISKVLVTLIDSASGSRFMFAYEDADGDGGAAPVIDTVQLISGHTYYSSLRVFDVTLADTAIELTGEIEEEAEAHQFFYTTPVNLFIRYDETDKDANGIYVGLKTVWRAGGFGNGAVKVILKHQPDLKKDGPKPGGDMSKGETDMEVSFPSRVL